MHLIGGKQYQLDIHTTRTLHSLVMDMNMQESEMEKDKCVSEIIQNGTNKRVSLA